MGSRTRFSNLRVNYELETFLSTTYIEITINIQRIIKKLTTNFSFCFRCLVGCLRSLAYEPHLHQAVPVGPREAHVLLMESRYAVLNLAVWISWCPLGVLDWLAVRHPYPVLAVQQLRPGRPEEVALV